MQLRTIAIIFWTVFFLGGALLVALKAGGYLTIAWVLLFAISQRYVLRCPYCDKLAYGRDENRKFRLIGALCRHCGEPY